MTRALVIAATEFRGFVRARSFWIGLLLPPLIGGLVWLGTWWAASSAVAASARGAHAVRIAVLDRSGSLFGALEIAAAQRNDRLRWVAGNRPVELVKLDPPSSSDEAAFADLGRRIHAGEFDAWAEIPADADSSGLAEIVPLRVVCQDGFPGEVVEWLERASQDELRTRALRSSSLPEAVRARLGRTVEAKVEAPPPAPGEARDFAPDPDAAGGFVGRLLAESGPHRKSFIAVPLAMILFLAVTFTAMPLFQAVLEEKSSRVSEILIASVSSTQLMLGKLVGSLAACAIFVAVYVGVLFGLLLLLFGAAIPGHLLALFAVYLLLSLLLWGAIFLALGAACVDAKDAQNLMVPAMLLQTLPVFFMSIIAFDPSGHLARALSLFPPTAPITMMVRLGADPAPQAVEIALSVALLAATSFACVWAAGRVLRVGLLAYGRSASMREIARWILAR